MVIFKPGDLIVKCYPYAHCVTGGEKNTRCHYCLKRMPFMKRCSKCRTARYCSSKCQAKDWKYVHQLECKYFKEDSETLSHLFQGDTIRLVLRILLMNKKYPHKAIEEVETIYGKKSFSTLINHSDELFNEPNDRYEQIHNMALFFEMLGIEFEMDSYREIYSKVSTNSYTISNYFLNNIGTSVYIAASVFGHSCLSNTCHVFNGITMEIRATKEIDTQNEAITLSYVNPLYPRQKRLNVLAGRYYISCKCPRCVSPNEQEDADLIKSVEKFHDFMHKNDLQSSLEAGLEFLALFTPHFPYPTAIVTYVYDRLVHVCKNLDDEKALYFEKEWSKYLHITHGRDPQQFVQEYQDPPLIYNSDP
ncbi:N-lysine methyltransferase SMYD2-A-like [Brevipalpus obovatus]|uniref:N-lysine methyltransferase SMYD2-A-like n=1 Tax=Brevipalpus obovatus TaxID=246614 RepID=UPI003D9FA47D